MTENKVMYLQKCEWFPSGTVTTVMYSLKKVFISAKSQRLSQKDSWSKKSVLSVLVSFKNQMLSTQKKKKKKRKAYKRYNTVKREQSKLTEVTRHKREATLPTEPTAQQHVAVCLSL